MSDQWTDNRDVASDDAPEVLPERVTEESPEVVADDVEDAADVADEDATEEPADDAVATDEPADDVEDAADASEAVEADVEAPLPTDEDGDLLEAVDPVKAFKDDLAGKFGDWYVVHFYAGYENRVKANLETRITSLNMEEYIFEIQVPMEEVTEIKSGQRKLVRRVRMPGYVLVRMARVVSVDRTDEPAAAECDGLSARVRAYTYFAIPYSEVRTLCDSGVVEYRVFRRKKRAR